MKKNKTSIGGAEFHALGQEKEVKTPQRILTSKKTKKRLTPKK